jgi:type IV secretory pathway VirJ component
MIPAAAPRSRRRRWLRRTLGIGALVLGLAVALGLLAPSLGLIDNKAIRVFGAARQHPPVAAVYLSGDMGFRAGMGPKVARAIAARGVPVVGLSSPVAFGSRRTYAQSEAIVAGAIRTALARTGASRLILIGQSFGSDILAATLPMLPTELRSKVAAIVLVVPSKSVFFRADPTELTYHGTPDAEPAAAMRGVDWAPVACIYGVAERDSLCPALSGTPARVIGLPGGHFLHHDDKLLVATVVGALHAANPKILG